MPRKATMQVRLTLAEIWQAWQALDGIWESETSDAAKSARDKLSDAYSALKKKDDGTKRFEG